MITFLYLTGALSFVYLGLCMVPEEFKDWRKIPSTAIMVLIWPFSVLVVTLFIGLALWLKKYHGYWSEEK